MTEVAPTTATCPPHVRMYLESAIGVKNSQIDNVMEVKSAQQQVLILSLLKNNNNLHMPTNYKKALSNGNGKLVLRIWKNCAKWWNLNCNDISSHRGQEVERMARAEVSAYRIAKQALSKSQICIPTVLYFSHDQTEQQQSSFTCNDENDSDEKKSCSTTTISSNCCEPWALFEYVGPESSLFLNTRKYSTKWVDEMITIRHEFGFDEPHPRWGRVPVEDCLDYTLEVLRSIILPMHLYFYETSSGCDWSADLGLLDNGTIRGRRYGDMIDLYKSAYQTIREQMGSTVVENEYDAMHTCVGVLKTCIDTLETEARDARLLDISNVPVVLVHMDCQPQNLICCQDTNNDNTRMISILDWEEASYADPRFELLLLCRKVCANREQANKVWDYYESQVPFDIGPMEPWLKLETVHSLATLLLQSLDCGGRNPWESKPDLKGKIEREYQRLHSMGWNFCDEIILNS